LSDVYRPLPRVASDDEFGNGPMFLRLGTQNNPLTSLMEVNMSDDKSKRGAADRSRISLEQDYEVRDWTKSLGVTKAELTTAVKAVGNSAEKVREYLKKKK
jgi:Protein of unknown function (DUF3606)